MPTLITVIIFVLAVKLFFAWYFSPKQRGIRGERAVAAKLRANLPAEYIVLNDLYLPLPDGTTTQIDHVVVSQYGIFVVETKTYSGWIFGEEKSAKWSQSIYRKKSSFQNPIRQNYKHICALADNLGIDKSYFHNVVVFRGGCTFKTEMPNGVVYDYRVVKHIMSFAQPLIKSSQVQEVAEVIGEWQRTVSEVAKQSHVANLKQRHEGVRAGEVAPKCPYCGGPMVIRTPKKGGNPFYGCKAYPKCRGIVKVTS